MPKSVDDFNLTGNKTELTGIQQAMICAILGDKTYKKVTVKDMLKFSGREIAKIKSGTNLWFPNLKFRTDKSKKEIFEKFEKGFKCQGVQFDINTEPMKKFTEKSLLGGAIHIKQMLEKYDEVLEYQKGLKDSSGYIEEVMKEMRKCETVEDFNELAMLYGGDYYEEFNKLLRNKSFKEISASEYAKTCQKVTMLRKGLQKTIEIKKSRLPKVLQKLLNRGVLIFYRTTNIDELARLLLNVGAISKNWCESVGVLDIQGKLYNIDHWAIERSENKEEIKKNFRILQGY